MVIDETVCRIAWASLARSALARFRGTSANRASTLKPGGAGRVLHSAAAMASRLGLHKSQKAEFRRACNYLRNQRRFVNYAEYKRLGLPIGSGVTEAACKTVFTQRLKLSGMQWTREGAQVILRLRIVLLSRIWNRAYELWRSDRLTHVCSARLTLWLTAGGSARECEGQR
ncbi:MAG: hypothetical protein FJ297_18725 [Planctomycetes bacterium]|nr:hypothetical protein [Planctomycetota bacterium]